MKISMSKLIESAQKEQKTPVIYQDVFREYFESAERALIKSGYDKRYPKLFNDICEYAAHYRLNVQHKGIMFMGGTGCGKTEGAIRLAAMLDIEFVTTSEIIKAFGTEEYYRLILKCDIHGKPLDLIIDEVGTEPNPYIYYGTKYNVIADVLRDRYDAFKFHGSKTIITTNMPLTEIQAVYDDRVESRCWEMFKIVSYGGCDYRKMKVSA